MYDRSVVVRFRGGELMAIRITECREYLSVYNESSFCHRPSAQRRSRFALDRSSVWPMPRRLRADSDDAGHDRRVLVEDCRDGAVVHVNELVVRSGIGTRCANDVSSESTLVN